MCRYFFALPVFQKEISKPIISKFFNHGHIVTHIVTLSIYIVRYLGSENAAIYRPQSVARLADRDVVSLSAKVRDMLKDSVEINEDIALARFAEKKFFLFVFLFFSVWIISLYNRHLYQLNRFRSKYSMDVPQIS